MRDELLNSEIFDTMQEAKILIEHWRNEYNTIRPHSALGYRPPVPEVIVPKEYQACKNSLSPVYHLWGQIIGKITYCISYIK